MRFRKPKKVWPSEPCPGSGSSVEDSATFSGLAVRCPECGTWLHYGAVWGIPIPDHDRSTDPDALASWQHRRESEALLRDSGQETKREPPR